MRVKFDLQVIEFIGSIHTCLSDDIRVYFMRFGAVTVDWPHKSHSRGSIPPKGIAKLNLLLYQYSMLSLQVMQSPGVATGLRFKGDRVSPLSIGDLC